MKKIILIALSLTYLIGLSPPLLARSSINIPVSDPIYRDLDRLMGAGLIKSYLYGQRPYTQEEIVRMLHEAQEQLEKEKNSSITLDASIDFFLDLEDVINHRLQQYDSSDQKKDFVIAPLESLTFETTLLDSPIRQVPPSNGVGSINAFINPLVNYQNGRHYVDGSVVALETRHWAQLTPYFSLFAHPRFATLIPNTGPAKAEAIAQELYGKFGIGNFELQVGRDQIVWGQSPQGTFLFSTNARPLDMIKITNPHPFRFPWIFQHLGNFKGTFFLANLGPERFHKNDFLTGLKLSLQPHPLLELGLSTFFDTGGQGSPNISLKDGIHEFFGFIPFAGISDADLPGLANRISGIEGSLRIPPLRNLQLYLEMYIDDKSDTSFKAMFVDGNAYLAGFYLPRVFNNGLLDLRFEVKRTPAIFYRHSDFPDGHTLNGLLLGDPLGPDARGFEVTSNIFISPKTTVTFNMDVEFRDSNIDTRLAETQIITDLPRERRFRSIAAWQREWNDHWDSSLKLGYERASTFNFEPGRNLNNFLGQFLLTYHFPTL